VVRMHIVEPWRLFLLSSATLWRSRSIHGVKSRRGRAWHAHLPSLRELRVRLRVLVVTSSESLSTAGLSRCPRTVLKAQLLLFATCKGEANALRKSRLRDELLLVKAQLRFFGRSPARRPR
jgi:hypothetical protein